ncbi:hypothetical protein Aduo_007755 [Ancylostoma duodenale]
MTLILLLLAAINASNAYYDSEIVNVTIGTYRESHPSLFKANRRTLANDIKMLAERCGKPFSKDAIEIDSETDFNYKISFKAFCDCEELKKYAKSQGINFEEEYVQPKPDRRTAHVNVVYNVASASCDVVRSAQVELYCPLSFTSALIMKKSLER